MVAKFGLSHDWTCFSCRYDQPGWFWSRLILCSLGGLLLFTPSKVKGEFKPDPFKTWQWICWLLLLSKIYTLFFLRDVLTQSLLLCTFYTLGGLGLYSVHLTKIVLKTISLLTASTYLLAIIHKLNTDFLYSNNSCAIHGLEISFGLVPKTLDLAPFIEMALIYVTKYPYIASSIVLGLELTLALLCIRSSRYVWLVGFIFHLPLTLTIAPSFGSVMAVGWGAGILAEELQAKRSVKKRNHRYFIRLLAPFIYQKRLKLFALIILIFYGLHGLLSPYYGIEVQHSAAMLSNLRIDPKCSNSLLFSKPSYDPYIYIDEIKFGQKERLVRQQKVLDGLWNLAALEQMKKNWCIPEQRPLYLKGIYGGIPFNIGDLCADHSLFEIKKQSSLSIFTGWQRFQKNLQIDCQQACVH